MSTTRPAACAVPRRDLLAVNGHDEAYEGWGKEDDDLSRRLRAAGRRPVSLIGIAQTVHQYHLRQPWRPVRRRPSACTTSREIC